MEAPLPSLTKVGDSRAGEDGQASEETLPRPPVPAPPRMTPEEIDALAKSLVSPYQMVAREYKEILSVLAARAPINVLVFGVGLDSGAYVKANSGKGARTLFVEHDAAWIEKVRAQHPELEIMHTVYASTVGASMKGLREGLTTTLETGALPLADWDVIIVDGPPGEVPKNPGREVPIREAALHARRTGHRKRVDVFVHDVNRELESAACEVYFKGYKPVGEYDRSRHYVFLPDEAA